MAALPIVTPEVDLAPRAPVLTGSPARCRRNTNCCELDHVKHSAYQVLMYAQKMTSGGKNPFFGSMRVTARRCRIDKSTVNEAYKKLVADGWFVPMEEAEWRRGETRYYQVLTHAQWVEKNGNSQCSR